MYNYPPIVPFGGRSVHGDHEDSIIILRRSYSRAWKSRAGSVTSNTGDQASVVAFEAFRDSSQK